MLCDDWIWIMRLSTISVYDVSVIYYARRNVNYSCTLFFYSWNDSLSINKIRSKKTKLINPTKVIIAKINSGGELKCIKFSFLNIWTAITNTHLRNSFLILYKKNKAKYLHAKNTSLKCCNACLHMVDGLI